MNIAEKREIEILARDVKEMLRLEYNIIDFRDPFKVISKMEKYIVIKAPNNENVMGFHIKRDDFDCIYINSNDVLGKQNYSCWHEFYHSIDDEDDGVSISLDTEDNIKEVEAKANYFASCMLLDKEEINEFLLKNKINIRNVTINDMIHLQYNFRVSFEALKLRLVEIYDSKIFFKFTENGKNNVEIFEEYITGLGYPLDLIRNTKDFVCPKMFLDNIIKGLKENRINLNKGIKLLNFFEEEGVKFEW